MELDQYLNEIASIENRYNYAIKELPNVRKRLQDRIAGKNKYCKQKLIEEIETLESYINKYNCERGNHEYIRTEKKSTSMAYIYTKGYM